MDSINDEKWLLKQRRKKMGKGSGRRPSAVSEAELEKAWNSIFAGHPTEGAV